MIDIEVEDLILPKNIHIYEGNPNNSRGPHVIIRINRLVLTFYGKDWDEFKEKVNAI